MVSQEYSSPTLFTTVFQNFDDLRKNEKYCDICLTVSNNKIHAHKIVLASVSSFFQNLFDGPFSESGKNEIELKDLKHEIISLLINFMYTGKITITSENVYDVYITADRYQILFVKEFCAQFLEEIMNIDNCIKIWHLASACVSEKLQITAKNFIASDLKFVSNKMEFLNLSKEQLSEILSLRSENESPDAFIGATINWAKFDEEHRNEFLRTFLKNIPPTLISREYLDKSLSTNEFLQADLSFNEYLLRTYREKSLENSEKVKLNTSIIIIAENNEISTSYYYLHDKAFKNYRNVKEIVFCGLTYKKSLYVFGSQGCYSSYGRGDAWKFEFYNTHNEKVRAVTLNDSIYMIGGSNDKCGITKYDINTGKTDKYCLKRERLDAGVTVIGGSIYICGGIKTNSVERFDPRQGISRQIGMIPVKTYSATSATSLSSSIYCIQSKEMNMLDIRNSRKWGENDRTFLQNMDGPLCTSYGKIICGGRRDQHTLTLYEIDSNNLNPTELSLVSTGHNSRIYQIVANE